MPAAGDTNSLDNFIFTQHSLMAFENCPLKFKKRYLEGLRWDLPAGTEGRMLTERGRDFHLLAQRYFMGIDLGPPEIFSEYPELAQWMKNLVQTFKIEPGCRYLPEHRMRINSGELKLEANFDLLMVREGSVEIWDWKTHGGATGAAVSAKGRKLEESLQTVVYMVVLKEQLSLLTGINEEGWSINMHYWQPEPPGIIGRIHYSDELHEGFKRKLVERIREIHGYDYTVFDKTLYAKHCKYCEFNWLCNKTKAAEGKEWENDEFVRE